MNSIEQNALSKIHILVVEDDRIMRTLVRDMLQIMGFSHVTLASDGLEAIECLNTLTPDIIVCDWKMQGMDGLAMTQFIRERAPGGKRFVPIIMLTGRSEEHHVLRARDAGINEYLIKPFTAQHLFDRIKMVIENPRGFVISDDFIGPDRRRQRSAPPDGARKRETD
jgi:DNA-binding response OmpR family regulator